MTAQEAGAVVGDYKAGWHDPENSTIRFDNGLSEQVVRDISALKDEPEWMTEFRVKAYRHYEKRPMPTWGNMSLLEQIDFDNICYFLRSGEGTETNWDDVPEDRSEEHTSELQSRTNLVCRLLLEKKNIRSLHRGYSDASGRK